MDFCRSTITRILLIIVVCFADVLFVVNPNFFACSSDLNTWDPKKHMPWHRPTEFRASSKICIRLTRVFSRNFSNTSQHKCKWCDLGNCVIKVTSIPTNIAIIRKFQLFALYALVMNDLNRKNENSKFFSKQQQNLDRCIISNHPSRRLIMNSMCVHQTLCICN